MRFANNTITSTPDIASELTNQVVPKRSANSVIPLNSINRNAAPNNQKCQSGLRASGKDRRINAAESNPITISVCQ
ncbi:MAG: hypothetical protein A2136_07390 [Chloroflexi bacterium RBG_16_54_11]|nr:MAG: hypothetical protein A2136_07390 [Chloroflexi bacterium RBG_16_54_11]